MTREKLSYVYRCGTYRAGWGERVVKIQRFPVVSCGPKWIKIRGRYGRIDKHPTHHVIDGGGFAKVNGDWKDYVYGRTAVEAMGRYRALLRAQVRDEINGMAETKRQLAKSYAHWIRMQRSRIAKAKRRARDYERQVDGEAFPFPLVDEDL